MLLALPPDIDGFSEFGEYGFIYIVPNCNRASFPKTDQLVSPDTQFV